jgi:PAS domain S-box-containing protein
MSDSPTYLLNSSLSEIHFNSIVKGIDQLITVADAETYIISYVNRVQPPLTKEDVVGKHIFQFTSAEHAAMATKIIEEVKRTGIPASYDIETTSVSRREGKMWYRSNISIIKGEGKSIESILFILEDITDRKQKEIENINSEERIKAIINNTTDIICSIDNNYNLLEFNSTFAAMVQKGYRVAVQPGMPVLQFVDPERHEQLLAFYKRAQQGETCFDIASFGTSLGNVVFNETSYNPIYNADKKISGISIFSKDITERVKSEQKIKNALKEKEVLLAEIHHRIKNNLAMVSSLLQLQELNISNHEAKDALVQSRKRIKSTALIHELLYRSESFQHINLKDYLSELFDHLKINDAVQLVITGDPVVLDLTTAMPLGLMLNEIMLNSFKHSHIDSSNGRTEISTAIKNNILTIEYCDCGGVFPEEVDFRNSQTTGLTLIHTFAEQLNGSIELISRIPPIYKIQISLDENR